MIGLGKADGDERVAAERLYETLREAGIEVLLDDRDAGAGEKFADAELLGCPLRLTVGRRSLEDGLAEAQGRRGALSLAGVPLGEGTADAVIALLNDLP
ncbi:unannotated protein [freshwater metagenome]|uniref:Unannotated protein n=1 Tax=freshwater metagenome TaxID=449393 RepID=A0A6J7DK84_9ZZZZ